MALSSIVVLLAGLGAIQGRPRPAPAEQAVRLQAAGAVSGPKGQVAPHTVPLRARPAVRPAARPAVRPVMRWLPTGTGMWLHDFRRSEGGNAARVVARARHTGLSTLYVRTGSTHDGWTGAPVLGALLPRTRGTVVKVVAWDFPELKDPVADARRMARAAWFSCPGCPRVAAVAPDVETASEGTRIGDARVALYYATLRRLLPAHTAILATVPWPSSHRVGRYPYARTAVFADALLPMAYWYNNSPADVTTKTMGFLLRYGRPVMPVGQGYDGRLDAPYLPADPAPGRSVDAFLRTARAHGARSVSLWSWQTTGGQQWSALAHGHALFRTR